MVGNKKLKKSKILKPHSHQAQPEYMALAGSSSLPHNAILESPPAFVNGLVALAREGRRSVIDGTVHSCAAR